MDGKPVNSVIGMVLSLLGAAVFTGAVIYVGIAGVPGGSAGGTSNNQQQLSGAPEGGKESTFGNAGTRETTGYGAPVGARPPREP